MTKFVLVLLKYDNIKMAVVWVLALCSLVEVYRRFRGAWRNNPEDSHLHTRRRENL
jgi:hypothetical protein